MSQAAAIRSGPATAGKGESPSSNSELRKEYPQKPVRDFKDGKLPPAELHVEVALLTGGQDRHYAFGLAMALIEKGVCLDVIGSDLVDGPEMHITPRLRFLNLHGSKRQAGIGIRVMRLLVSYARLIRYAFTATPRIFHILWNNTLPLFDRTILTLLYKLAGKKILFTAHNVNAGRRDRRDSWVNRITLRCQYTLADHIFVHTSKMKDELVREFAVEADKVTIIPYGINNAVPFTALTREEARRKLGLRNDEKAILYFGAIKRYKGLEDLVAAFLQIATRGDYRLIIAGERKKGHEAYWRSIQQTIERDPNREKVLQKIEFIPDPETEFYFKAADVAVLPYTEIFQSGILFLTYAYGLPVIATDVGSFSEDIVEGRTGFICKPRDPDALATTIQRYFETDLYRGLEDRHQEIREYALSRHSWDIVADRTRAVYSTFLERVS
jgi:D-inositol-3-phosphate glycosyltransferase